jgi:ubiquitin-activating enzyme E1
MQYFKDPAAYGAAARKACDHTARVSLESIVDCVTKARCKSFDDCIAISRRRFEERFHHKIAQLIYMFPEDAKTSSGAAFWSPPKRFPTVVKFDPADPSHAAYAQSSAILFAELYGVKRPEWAGNAAEVAKRAATVPVRIFLLPLLPLFRPTLSSCTLRFVLG